MSIVDTYKTRKLVRSSCCSIKTLYSLSRVRFALKKNRQNLLIKEIIWCSNCSVKKIRVLRPCSTKLIREFILSD